MRICSSGSAQLATMELTRFSGHLDTWDHESHKEVRYDPKVHPRVPAGVPS
jgi:hypothetical protein